MRRQLIESNGFPAERITSVPTGIDARRFAPGDRAAARRALGLPAGRNPDRHRGDAAKLERPPLPARGLRRHCRASDCLLVVVGDGPQRADLESQIAGLNIGERVRMAGNQADVLPWLQALDVFALPSYANEGVPQALVQAMLCALPCVTTDVGSIGEAAVDGETALVVAPQDAGALRDALLRLIESPGLRQRLGAAARVRCAERFGFESMLDAMEAVFERVVASQGSEHGRAA